MPAKRKISLSKAPAGKPVAVQAPSVKPAGKPVKPAPSTSVSALATAPAVNAPVQPGAPVQRTSAQLDRIAAKALAVARAGRYPFGGVLHAPDIAHLRHFCAIAKRDNGKLTMRALVSVDMPAASGVSIDNHGARHVRLAKAGIVTMPDSTDAGTFTFTKSGIARGEYVSAKPAKPGV